MHHTALVWCAIVLGCFPTAGIPSGIADNPQATDTATAASGTATIHGKVRVTRKLISQRMRFRLYPGIKPIAPPEDAHETDEKKNIVIYLDRAEPGEATTGKADGQPHQTAGAAPNPSIRQEGETFIPHVLPIVKGSTVDFPNLDPIFHNVFSLSGTMSFDLGRYPRGDTRSVTFEKSGVVPVFCHLHSDMSAIILVLDNPWFSVPDADGSYRIENIPAGTYTLVGWHERSERTEQKITLQPGDSVELDILIPIEDEE